MGRKKARRRMKGNIADVLFISVFAIMFSLSILMSYFIWGQISPAINATLTQSEGGTLNTGSALALTQTNTTLLMFDQLFVFIIFGSFVAVIISCLWLDTHPVFFIISLLLLIFSFVIFAVLGNVYYEFEHAAGIQESASNFPLMETFWQNIPTIGLFVCIIVVILIYSKFRGKPNPYSA